MVQERSEQEVTAGRAEQARCDVGLGQGMSLEGEEAGGLREPCVGAEQGEPVSSTVKGELGFNEGKMTRF